LAKESFPKVVKALVAGSQKGLDQLATIFRKTAEVTKDLPKIKEQPPEEDLLSYLGAVMGENKIPSLPQLQLTTKDQPPLIVSSAKMVANLNAQMIAGYTIDKLALASDLKNLTVDVANLKPGTFGGTTDYTFPGNLKISGGQLYLEPIPEGAHVEGVLYFDRDNSKLYVRSRNQWVDLSSDNDTTYTASDGLDLSSDNKFSVDVTDILGTGLAEDAANNIILDTSYAAVLGTAQTFTANKTFSSAATLYFAGGTTYYIDSSGHASFNNLTAAGTISLPADSITDAMIPNTITVSNYLPLAGGTMTGTITTSSQEALKIGPYGTAAGQTGELRLLELAAQGTNYVGFKAPDSLAGNVIWTLPASGGTAGFALTTDGAGTLSWSQAGVNDATYLTLSTHTSLSAERVLTAGTNLSLTDAGANSTLTIATVANPTFSTSVTSPSFTGSGAVSLTSGGANTLTLDTGGSAAVSIGATNTSGVNIGRAGITTAVTGTLTTSGNINSTGGALQTNSVTRIDNSGNVSGANVTFSGDLTASGNSFKVNSVSATELGVYDSTGTLIVIFDEGTP
jgi:hypothetical protein